MATKEPYNILGGPTYSPYDLSRGRVNTHLPTPRYFGTADTSGNLKDQFKYNPTLANQGTLPGYGQLKQDALGQGPTRYADPQLRFLQRSLDRGASRIRSQSASGIDDALTRLQVSGGTTGGARERVAGLANQGLISSLANLYSDYGQRGVEVLATDADRRRMALKDLLGVGAGNIDLQNQAQASNIKRASDSLASRSDFNRLINKDFMDALMRAFSANEIARKEQEEASKGLSEQIGEGIFGRPSQRVDSLHDIRFRRRT